MHPRKNIIPFGNINRGVVVGSHIEEIFYKEGAPPPPPPQSFCACCTYLLEDGQHLVLVEYVSRTVNQVICQSGTVDYFH